MQVGHALEIFGHVNQRDQLRYVVLGQDEFA